MATIRYLVADVDASIKFYELLGFSLKDRWGPPFEATVARMKSARATILVEAVRGPAGQQALVSDPSGNPVELFERRKDEG